MTENDEAPLRFASPSYSLTFPSDRPYVYLQAQNHSLAELFILSGVQPWNSRDDTTEVGSWQREDRGDETIYTLPVRSSAWDRKLYRLRCRPDRFIYEIEVEGSGRLDEVQYFGGYMSAYPRWGSGFFPSGQRFVRGFNPEPNAANANYFAPSGGALLDLVGGPLPGKRHWFFTPAPFCFAFESAAGWLAVGVEADAGDYSFTTYRYHGGDSFWLSLTYEGHTEVSGTYRLPAIAFDFSGSAFDAVAAHVDGVQTRLDRPPRPEERPDWWTHPMFCGWGEQCYLAGAEHGYLVEDSGQPDYRAFIATMKYAAGYARQDRYEDFLRSLEKHGLRPGTIVIDDKWQSTYGENEVDQEKWPDLPGFVAARHASGQHVLLWLKAWDPEGVLEEECIRNAAGAPLSVDPTNPAFQRRLRASVRRMVLDYGADGFKIDFTHRIPNGPDIRTDGPQWGLELMRLYLWLMYDEAKKCKPDALVMTHTPHPYLADVLDMIRLNDMQDLSRPEVQTGGLELADTLSLRTRIARIACPHALIDTDNWPVLNKAAWREYLRLQPSIGVPSLYNATHIDITQEPLEPEDYESIRQTWEATHTGVAR